MATQEDYSQGIRDWFTNRSGYQSTYPLDYSHTNEDLNDWYNDWGRFGLANPLTPGGASTYRPNDVQWDQIQDFFNQRGIDNNRWSIANVFKDFNLMPDSVAKTLSEEQTSTPAVENNSNPMSDKDWLTSQYNTYFARDPIFGGKLADGRDDPGDADYWLDQLAGGMSRSDVVTHLNTSPESNELRSEIFRLANDPSAPTDVNERFKLARSNTPLGGQTMADAKANFTGIFQDPNAATTETETETETETPAPTSGGGGGYSGPSLDDFRSMLLELFDSPWTPVGYGWGGTNADAVRINRSQGSRRGRSYAGNKSSFNRSGSRLSQGTPWMNTLGM